MQPVTELRLQQMCFMFFWNQYPQYRGLLFRIKNEGTSRISGAVGKATGIVPGVSDMCLLRPDGKGPVFLEFKTEKGKQSESQKNWQGIIWVAGYSYQIIRSLDQFKELCQKLGL
jgi:hypothetical protein